MAKFEASTYSQFRVTYPEKLFSGLKSYCASFQFQRSMRILDLGGGTGFSTRSFLDFFQESEITLVEPDPEMLKHAQKNFENETSVQLIQSRAETYEISTPFDLLLVGSAWHWMDRPKMIQKFEGADFGAAFIFEYQFPKAKTHGELNEWVRRAFNLKWRTIHQEPRGNLIELTQGFRDSNFFFEQNRVSFFQEEIFDLERFWGMIISQSRFLAYEETLSAIEKNFQRKLLFQELTEIWKSEVHQTFLLPYEGVFFLKRKM